MGNKRCLREKMKEENDLNIIHVGNYQENKEFEELNSVKSQSGTEKKKYFSLHKFTNNECKY